VVKIKALYLDSLPRVRLDVIKSLLGRERIALRGFRYPTFLSLVLTFEFKGSSLSYFTTAHSGDSNLLHLNTKPSLKDGALNPILR